jgi:hypothetical protein
MEHFGTNVTVKLGGLLLRLVISLESVEDEAQDVHALARL